VNNYEEYMSTLTELGLSIIQAKIYLSLAKSSNLKAHEISSISGVARPDVYRVLSQLEEAGLVERIISKPEEFAALPFEQCVSNLIQRRMLKTLELQKKVYILTQDFKQNNTDEKLNEKFQLILLPSKDVVYAKCLKMLEEVQMTMEFLCLTRRMISWLSIYQSQFEAALDRKVKCKVIMPKPKPELDIWKPIKTLKDHPNFNLKYIQKDPKFAFSVWDNKEMLITTVPIDSPTPATTLWSNNSGIVDLCHEHFECIWIKAEKAST
jgi:sugar-specific transcriptional regulator TrmB